MLTGIDRDEKIEFKSSFDKDAESPTIFLIGNISNRDKLKLFEGVSDSSKISEKMSEKAFDILKAGLKGINGLKDKKTGEAKNITKIDDDVLNLVPFEVLGEVLNKIVAVNFTTETEEKN